MRLFTRRGYDWSARYPAIARTAAANLRASSFTFDGEAIVCGPDGVAIFDALRLTKQHSIVQRLLKALRKKAAEKLIAQEPPCPAMTIAPLPGAVDGSGYAWPDPPTAPPVEPALEVGRLNGSIHTGS